MNKLSITTSTLLAVFVINISICQNIILQSSNKRKDKTLASIENYSALVSEIENNFFYNPNDSLYVENQILTSQSYTVDFYNTLIGLNMEQMICLLGEPHFRDSTSISYITKKNKFPECDGLIYKRIFIFENSHFRNIFAGLQVKDNMVNKVLASVFRRNKSLPVARNIKKCTFQVKSKRLSKVCSALKNNFQNTLYLNTKTQCHIYSTGSYDALLHSYWSNCESQFSLKEIISIFENAPIVINNNLYFKLSNRPYNDISSTEKVEHDSKTLCLCFTKVGNANFYEFSWPTYVKLPEIK